MIKHLQKKHIQILGILFLTAILILGSFLTVTVGRSMKQDEESNLLLRAEMIAVMLNVDDVSDLSGNELDLEKESYGTIKSLLTEIRMLNMDTRFIYLMGLNDQQQQFFHVDSEPIVSEDYSGPGDLYLEATERDIRNHLGGIPYTDGPYIDSWGEWISAYAPIFDDEKNVVAFVGMDVTAEKILLRIRIVQQAIMLIFSLVFVVSLLFLMYARKIARS